MAITRYDPFRDLFRLQDQLFKTFGEAYAPREESGLTAAWTPAVDVFEDADAITLKVELPEVDAKDVDSFTLPSTVDAEHISAESRDGVLRIVLPKRAETKPRQIRVQVEAARPSQVAAPAKQ